MPTSRPDDRDRPDRDRPDRDSDDDELVDALEAVCAQLGGEPVPDDLAALWRAQLRGDTELFDAFELVLLDDLDPADVLAGFTTDDGVAPAAAAALQRFIAEVRFVAEIGEGLLGYWVGPDQRSIRHAPVVLFDGDGQFELVAMSIAEALVSFVDPDDEDDIAEVVSQLRSLRVGLVATTHHAIWESVAGFEEPSGVVLRYQIEAGLKTL